MACTQHTTHTTKQHITSIVHSVSCWDKQTGAFSAISPETPSNAPYSHVNTKWSISLTVFTQFSEHLSMQWKILTQLNTWLEEYARKSDDCIYGFSWLAHFCYWLDSILQPCWMQSSLVRHHVHQKHRILCVYAAQACLSEAVCCLLPFVLTDAYNRHNTFVCGRERTNNYFLHTLWENEAVLACS